MRCKKRELRRKEKLSCLPAAAAVLNLGYNIENASELQQFARRVLESRRRLITWTQLSGTDGKGW
jgi:hypothetical protein